MIDRMLLTGIAIGALPQLLHARFWFQSTLAPLGAVTIVGRFTGDWLTAGSFWAVAVGTVIVGACFALTHHANHMNSPTEA